MNTIIFYQINNSSGGEISIFADLSVLSSLVWSGWGSVKKNNKKVAQVHLSSTEAENGHACWFFYYVVCCNRLCIEQFWENTLCYLKIEISTYYHQKIKGHYLQSSKIRVVIPACTDGILTIVAAKLSRNLWSTLQSKS